MDSEVIIARNFSAEHPARSAMHGLSQAFNIKQKGCKTNRKRKIEVIFPGLLTLGSCAVARCGVVGHCGVVGSTLAFGSIGGSNPSTTYFHIMVHQPSAS